MHKIVVTVNSLTICPIINLKWLLAENFNKHKEFYYVCKHFWLLNENAFFMMPRIKFFIGKVVNNYYPIQ